MAVIQYKGINKTVANIIERNAIQYKIDHMVVVVLDAIADVAAGSGKATYRYDATDDSWILISKSTNETMSFSTEELTIANGKVTASNIPADNQIWEILVTENNIVMGNLKIEDLTISNGVISGLDEFNGKKIRFSYAYGSITQQLNVVLDDIKDSGQTGTF